MRNLSPNHPSLQDRKDAIGQRRWADYAKRKSKARRRNLVTALAIMFATAFTDNATYIYPAFLLVLVTALPYIDPRNK